VIFATAPFHDAQGFVAKQFADADALCHVLFSFSASGAIIRCHHPALALFMKSPRHPFS